jgi:hypothetical protein
MFVKASLFLKIRFEVDFSPDGSGISDLENGFLSSFIYRSEQQESSKRNKFNLK